MDYTPRARSFLIPAALIAGGCIAVWYAMDLLGACLIVLGFGVAFVLGVVAVNASRASVYAEMAEYAHRCATIPEDRIPLLGLKFPSLRIRSNGRYTDTYFEDTGVPMWFVCEFVAASTHYTVMPVRAILADDKRGYSRDTKREMWAELVEWLKANKFIIPSRNATDESYPWHVGMYEQFRDQYAPRRLANLGTVEPAPAFVPEAEEARE